VQALLPGPGANFHDIRATTATMDTRGIAVFDVCGTLTKTNNTSDFIAFVLRRDDRFRYALFLFLRVCAGLLHRLGIRRLFKRDLIRDRQIAFLRGYSCARLQERSKQYVDGLSTKGLLNRGILEALAQEKKQGKAVWLVSSAIDPPIVEIAKRLQVANYYSSELETRDGHYTGRLKTDLLGDKQTVLERMAVPVDLRSSSVYSDNPEDAAFMARFGTRHVVRQGKKGDILLSSAKHGRIKEKGECPLFSDKDVDSVNARTRPWVYVPGLYYVLSRFHREGVFSLLLRDLVPATLASYLFTNLGILSFVIMPLSFLMFYAIYEVGGLVNDLSVKREAPGKGRTSRIAPGVHLSVALFIALRLAFVGLLLASLSLGTYPTLLYAGALAVCLVLFFLHTLILSDLRVFTFLLLKICRSAIPLAILVPRLGIATWAWLSAIFVILDAPVRVYAYCHSRGLVKGTMSVSRLRCMSAAILWGSGAVLYRVEGSPWLLALASYYVALDGLGALRGKPSFGRE